MPRFLDETPARTAREDERRHEDDNPTCCPDCGGDLAWRYASGTDIALLFCADGCGREEE